MVRRGIDETDNVYGTLTVRRRVEALFWACRCRCGRWRIAEGYALRMGWVTTCGVSACTANDLSTPPEHLAAGW